MVFLLSTVHANPIINGILYHRKISDTSYTKATIIQEPAIIIF